MLGTGAGLILRGSASSGGFDILAVILNQKYKLPVATVMNICDVLVILMLALGKPLLPTVYGILTITISAAIVEELCERPSPLLEGESFRSRMMNCLLMAQQMTAQRPPKVVLLTGGASRMAFFQQLCRETFPDSVLHVSATPEFDIARGLAYAGHVDEMVRRR